jgi:hypothetical protein
MDGEETDFNDLKTKLSQPDVIDTSLEMLAEGLEFLDL